MNIPEMYRPDAVRKIRKMIVDGGNVIHSSPNGMVVMDEEGILSITDNTIEFQSIMDDDDNI